MFKIGEEEEDEEGGKGDQEALERGATPPGVLDQSGWVIDRTMMWQSYRLLESAGAEGLSQQQLGQKLGQGKLEARTICRNLLRRKLVVTVMKDIGRQRVTCYVARKWQHLSHGATQYRVEKDKNDQLLGSGFKVEVKEEEEVMSPKKISNKTKKRKKRKSGKEEVVEGKRMKQERMSTVMEEEVNSGEGQTDATMKEVSPLPVVEEDETAIQISISRGFQFREAGRKKAEKEGGGTGETFRQLRRANTIIEAVRLNKVVDDPTKLYKMIQEQEQEEGYTAKMDKKSLMRLLTKLDREGQVLNIRVKLKHTVGDRTKVKTLHFVCNPDVSEENTIIQSAIEQAKMKFNIPPRTTAMIKEETEFQSDSIRSSVDAILELEGGGKSSNVPCVKVYPIFFQCQALLNQAKPQH